MALEQTNANIAFANGNWTSATKDSNGFWISIGTYNSSANIEANETTIDISDLTLNHNSSGMFSSYTLSVYLRAEYTYGGQLFYKYFFGDSNGTTVGQKTMSSTSLSLLTSTQIASVTIPHNLDGPRTDLVIRGINYDFPDEAGWDIARTETGEKEPNGYIMPKLIEIKSIKFTPIHNFIPKTVSEKFVISGSGANVDAPFISFGKTGAQPNTSGGYSNIQGPSSTNT